jgi:RNA polymerase sigma-70 factor (ECF subfamily)
MLPEYPCLPSPEQQAADAERLHALADLLAQLPSACQAVFVLNRIEGYTQAEIAQQLGISTSMVAKHLARALKWCHAHVRNP